MSRSCRFSVLSTVVVLAHGLQYATWTLEGPRADASTHTTTRIELKDAVDPFDSEQPRREGQARAELLMKSGSVDSGVSYLQVTRPSDKPGHASIEAVMTSMKPAFIATQVANGANVQEMPAGSFSSPGTLAQLHQLAAQLGDDLVAVFIGTAVNYRFD